MKRGYTLLEVLITSAVMVLLVLAAYPTLNGATRRQEQITNMTILETCVVQGIAAAKAPTQADTTTIHIIFTTAPIGCRIAEVNAAGTQSVISSFAVANPQNYTLTLSPVVTNNEYVVNVRPPYAFIVPSTAELLMVSLRTAAAPFTINSTYFNLITGTIQLRSS